MINGASMTNNSNNCFAIIKYLKLKVRDLIVLNRKRYEIEPSQLASRPCGLRSD